MKAITFPAAGKLAGVASMLECLGEDAGDLDIARGMEAPFLLVRDGNTWRAGAGLYHPRWINLSLGSRGFRLEEHVLPREDVGDFLRGNSPAMLKMILRKDGMEPVVFTGYAQGRYIFSTIVQEDRGPSQTLSLTGPMLRRRLQEQTAVHTLSACEPCVTDFVPMLKETLENIPVYREALLETRFRTVTRAEYDALHTPLFRALMQDLRPMALLMGDETLAEELRRLEHDYRHIFVFGGPDEMTLEDRLPKSSICKCLLWYREAVVDRLYELTGQDHWQSYAPLTR